MELDFASLLTQNYRLAQLTIYYGNVVPPCTTLCKSGEKLYDRFFYIVRGTFLIQGESGETISVSAGEILYLPFNATYLAHWDEREPGEYYTVAFVLRDSDNRAFSIGKQIGIAISDPNREHLAFFRELYADWVNGAYGYYLQCCSQFWNILYRFSLSAAQSAVEKESRIISKGILFLENNYTSDVSTDELAALCGISACTFRRLFREYKGITPVKYKNLLRMRKARELLESGEYTVSEACEAVGCPDIFYFSKLFLRIYGFSPSLCKNHLRSNNTNND